MNKKVKSLIAALTCVALAPMSMIACGVDKGGGGSIDENGDLRPGGKEALVEFWISGDDVEIEVFGSLVDDFNKEFAGVIKVDMVQRSGDGYDSALGLSLESGNAPDIFYVGDSGYKHYAERDLLFDLTDWISNSKIYKLEEMWDTVTERYKYDVNTYLTGTDTGRYYGVPKDIGPTVIFYNEDWFELAGVKTISVAKEDLDKYNAGDFADARGNTKTQMGITGKVKEKGYFVDNGHYFFNNQIPMNWDETVACAKKVQDAMRTEGHKSQGYGYFTEWWFNYGWSVGGNCIQQIPSDQYDCGYYYDFTLMDDTPNFIVADDVAEGVTVNGKKYEKGTIIEYKDKLDMSIYAGKKAADGASMYTNASNYRITQEVLNLESQGKLNRLPSQRYAFTEFVRTGDIRKSGDLVEVETGKKCYGISPLPTDIDGDAGKVNEFESGNIAMLVDGRWNVSKFRNDDAMKNVKWDVAPLPMYKEYYEAGDDIPEGKEVGDVKVHGIEAGHSGSVALCISKTSVVAPEAWKFIEYVGGPRGQSLQAEAGFAIPLQKELANSDVFLQPGKRPYNSKVFIRATEYERAGDWWQLQDNAWIDAWAGQLNGEVRNAKKTLSEFFTCDEYKGTFAKLHKYTENKNS